MPYLLSRLLLTLMCLCTGAVTAAGTASAGSIVLSDYAPDMGVLPDIQIWADTGSQATVTLVESASARFSTASTQSVHPLTERDTLWVKLRLLRPVGSTATWTLNIPVPYLDSVKLYQRRESGGWSVQSAGDRLAQDQWSKPGLYPEFDLNLPVGQVQELYLQVRNFKSVSLPLRLASTQVRDTQRLLEVTALGLLLGCVLALAALTLLRYLKHKNRHDIWAAVYSLLILLTIAQINGMLNLFVWGSLPEWGNLAYGVIPLLASGAALLFVRRLYALSTHYHRYSRFLHITGWGTIASVLSYALFDRATADWFSAMVLVFALTVGLAAALLSWRGESSIWRWLVLAYVPQYLGLLRLLAETLELLPPLWEMRYLISASIALTVPLLVYALIRATHDRKELETRADLLPTQDALTGLLTEEVFLTHVEDALDRSISTREPIALILVKVINLEHIRQTLGDTVAEQCLLRAVVKLHRILRDVDPAGRVDTACFGLLLEGVATREAVAERMVQLIASGLIPLPGLQPPVTLQFQAACVLLHENPVPLDSALTELKTVLQGMSSHTRRPIRFLEAIPTEAAALQDSESL